jgi:hypothetical protein
MNIEIIVIIALICLNIGLTIVSTRLLTRNIAISVMNMDENLAEAIKVTIENLPEALRNQYLTDIDPPNPFQALIAQFMERKIEDLANPKGVIEVKKGEDGKFTS